MYMNTPSPDFEFRPETLADLDEDAELELEENTRRFFGSSEAAESRPDSEIFSELWRRLRENEEGWDLSRVEIQVKNGELTLHGVVEDYKVKRSVEDLCETILG